MIINFLQTRDPPILPSLQKMPGHRSTTINGEPSAFADDLASLRGCGDANKETLGQLLFHFFRLYSYVFDYSEYVISVKEGRPLSRKEKGWETSNYLDKEARNRLCVEEPFNTFRNLGNSADDYAFSGIHGEIRRAFELLADGQQLDKCCEQYEFPPEEKPIFQRPAPKPKPTLTRSASQSGRPNNEPGSSRSRKGNNRNQSAQRAGNRRASSGASFSNQRMPFTNSPPIGSGSSDYFAARGNLHDQLAQQYQLLQLQQDALRSQLMQQQQQVQSRVGDLAGSPQHRQYANGLPSPRYLDNPPQTAPLLPGYLYHYPARYPPPSPMSQSRSREGTSTNPSSPSLVAAVPALRRTIHRASVPEGSSSASVRSQSQPGRSLPHPLTIHGHAHPGYDVSGALGMAYGSARPSQGLPQGYPGLNMPMSPMTTLGPSSENIMPKEYVGYYVGQSPQLGPQYATQTLTMPPMPPLRDPPQRSRRVTPDLMPPVVNGRHASRSPSPLGHSRSYSTIADLRPAAPAVVESPIIYKQSLPEPEPFPALVESEIRAPLIVNGSNFGVLASQKSPEEQQNPIANGLGRVPTLEPISTTDLQSAEVPPSPRVSPSPRSKAAPRLSFSTNGTSHLTNGITEQIRDASPLTAPLLSPVAELRTPSPTRSRAFESPTDCQPNGVSKPTTMTNGKPANKNDIVGGSSHGRKDSENVKPSAKILDTSMAPPPTGKPNSNAWQQATGKKHKKSKSTASSKSPQGTAKGGEPLPFNEAERKGG